MKKKYIVTLTEAEREMLQTMLSRGKAAARKLVHARIPPKANAEFVWKMEDVLEVYKRAYDPQRPVVCLDETSKQLIGEVRTPVPAAPGQVAQYDYEYVRKGVANIFMVSEPLAGKRAVEVTDRRTKKDYAACLRKIADEMYPEAEVVVLVQDNLNTHSPASLYEAFPPAEA